MFQKISNLLKNKQIQSTIISMSEYYLKIKQNNTEIEFSTTDKAEFNDKLSKLMQLTGAADVQAVPKKKIEKKPTKKLVQKKAVAQTVIEEKKPKIEQEKVEPNVEEIKPLEPVQKTKEKVDEILKQTIEIERTQFDVILEQSIKKPVELVSPNFNNDNELENLIHSKNIKKIRDCVLVVANYLLKKEQIVCFTLKQINKKLYPIKLEAAGHDQINDLIRLGCIKIAANSDPKAITEYYLTQRGKDFCDAIK